jgi:hypothetical protein
VCVGSCRGNDRIGKRRANWIDSRETHLNLRKREVFRRRKRWEQDEERRGKLRERRREEKEGGNTEGGVVGIYRT